MKKLASIGLGLSLISGSAIASPFYAGLEGQFQEFKYEDTSNLPFSIEADDYYKKNMITPNVFGGYNINKRVAIELGYSWGSADKTNNDTGLVYASGPLNGQALTTSTTIDVKTLSLDGVFTQPLALSNFNVLGLVGISYNQFDLKESYNDGSSLSDKDRGLGISAGLGVSYDINESIAIRSKVKYTHLDSIEPSVNGLDSIDNIISISFGAKIDL